MTPRASPGPSPRARRALPDRELLARGLRLTSARAESTRTPLHPAAAAACRPHRQTRTTHPSRSHPDGRDAAVAWYDRLQEQGVEGMIVCKKGTASYPMNSQVDPSGCSHGSTPFSLGAPATRSPRPRYSPAPAGTAQSPSPGCGSGAPNATALPQPGGRRAWTAGQATGSYSTVSWPHPSASSASASASGWSTFSPQRSFVDTQSVA